MKDKTRSIMKKNYDEIVDKQIMGILGILIKGDD